MYRRNEVVSRRQCFENSEEVIKLVDIFAHEYLFDYGHNNHGLIVRITKTKIQRSE